MLYPYFSRSNVANRCSCCWAMVNAAIALFNSSVCCTTRLRRSSTVLVFLWSVVVSNEVSMANVEVSTTVSRRSSGADNVSATTTSETCNRSCAISAASSTIAARIANKSHLYVISRKARNFSSPEQYRPVARSRLDNGSDVTLFITTRFLGQPAVETRHYLSWEKYIEITI